MSDRSALGRAIAGALGAAVEGLHGVSGGDINDAFEARLADGRSVFVKASSRAHRSTSAMFDAEARGLAWLGEAGALRVPRVLAVSRASEEPAFLALERIDPAPKARDFDDQLGRGLAALHRFGAPSFGLDYDNFIATLPQPNTPCATWAELYWSRRLEPLLRRASDARLVSAAMRRGFADLEPRLEILCGPPEPPARVHGDLWGGNLLADDRGAPCLIDPSVYGGHREVDLAMMRLFGGFGARAFDAYDEAFPLADGHEDRVPLYQLYPLLVHVNLFGSMYVGSVERALGDLL